MKVKDLIVLLSNADLDSEVEVGYVNLEGICMYNKCEISLSKMSSPTHTRIRVDDGAHKAWKQAMNGGNA